MLAAGYLISDSCTAAASTIGRPNSASASRASACRYSLRVLAAHCLMPQSCTNAADLTSQPDPALVFRASACMYSLRLPFPFFFLCVAAHGLQASPGTLSICKAAARRYSLQMLRQHLSCSQSPLCRSLQNGTPLLSHHMNTVQDRTPGVPGICKSTAQAASVLTVICVMQNLQNGTPLPGPAAPPPEPVWGLPGMGARFEERAQQAQHDSCSTCGEAVHLQSDCSCCHPAVLVHKPAAEDHTDLLQCPCSLQHPALLTHAHFCRTAS